MDRSESENEIRRLIEEGDVAAATTRAIRLYGPEVLGLLVAVLRDEDDASDVFAEVSAHVWRDLPAFRWESSLRTWMYIVARHRLLAFRDRRDQRLVPLSRSPIDDVVQEVRTTTALHLRSEVKQAVTLLREQLDPDDRMMLILRIDRALSWREVADVMGVAEPALRKRFERVKTRLRDLAREHGIGR
jgi:RNA polymerase sigma-70 factor (ECF subfamily)